jgi:hypothetical protein
LGTSHWLDIQRAHVWNQRSCQVFVSQPNRKLTFDNEDIYGLFNDVGLCSDWLLVGWLRGRISSPGRVKNFLFTASRPALGPAQPPNQWIPRTLSPGIKRQGREADHSPPTIAKDKKMCIYTSTPSYGFML